MIQRGILSNECKTLLYCTLRYNISGTLSLASDQKRLHSFLSVSRILLPSPPRLVVPSILVVVLLQPAGPAREVCEDPGEVGDPRRLEGDAGVVGGQPHYCLHELHLRGLDSDCTVSLFAFDNRLLILRLALSVPWSASFLTPYNTCIYLMC